MIGLCHKCGFMGDPPPKVTSNRDVWAKLWKRLAKVQYARFEVVWKDYYLLRTERDKLLLENHKLRTTLEQRDVRLDYMLEILMSTSEAARISAVARIKKKFKSGKLLASMREANRE